jgi:hypothetical protein
VTGTLHKKLELPDTASPSALVALLWTSNQRDLYAKWIGDFRKADLDFLRKKGVHPVQQIHIEIFSPPCLRNLSRYQRAMADEHLVRAQSAQWKSAATYTTPHTVVMISYADLLWRFSSVAAAFQRDFGLNVSNDFVPKDGSQVFLYNQIKTNGTLRAFARTHPPSSLGYKHGECSQESTDRFSSTALGHLRTLINRSERWLAHVTEHASFDSDLQDFLPRRKCSFAKNCGHSKKNK